MAFDGRFGLGPIDGRSWCKCDPCQSQMNNDLKTNGKPMFASGEASEYWFGFVNNVAKEVKKTHPQAKFMTLAYAAYALPPRTFHLDPSVAIQVCIADSAKEKPVFGTHGVILLHNVRQVTVRNVTVRQSRPFAVHLSNIRDFTVDGLTLDRHGRDGVHVDGPASDGVIRNVSSDSHDDPVSLTAWDWRQYNVTFGPIHHLTIEHITRAPVDKHGTDAIRLLPGVKRFSDGTTLDCSHSRFADRFAHPASRPRHRAKTQPRLSEDHATWRQREGYLDSIRATPSQGSP